MSKDIENLFHKKMIEIYYRAKSEANYTASIFLDMVLKHGGLRTAKMLINSAAVSTGYTALYERNHLELTVEAVVIEDPQWHPLFTDDELNKAQKRLAAYHYTPKSGQGKVN